MWWQPVTQFSQNRLGAQRLTISFLTCHPSLCRQAPTGINPPYAAKGWSANQPKWLRRTKSHYRRLLPAFPLEVENSTLHPAGKPYTSVIHSSVSASCLSQLVTKSHCCTCCTYERPPHHFNPSVSSGHTCCLYYLSPIYSPGCHCHNPFPMTFHCFQSCDVPLLSDVTISSIGDSVSFRTWPSFTSSHLPYRCTILAMPDSSFQTTKSSFHLQFAYSCPSTQRPISHWKQTSNVLSDCCLWFPYHLPKTGMFFSLSPNSGPNPLLQSCSGWNYFLSISTLDQVPWWMVSFISTPRACQNASATEGPLGKLLN